MGPLVIDAAWFTPQSRPRLFLIGVRRDLNIGAELTLEAPDPLIHSAPLVRAAETVGDVLWWRLPPPPVRNCALADIIDAGGWAPPEDTLRLLGLMSAGNQAKVSAAKAASINGAGIRVGAVFRRTRLDRDGARTQRAEVRFDDLAGCLRTPAGGSSRQTLLVANAGEIQTRLLTPRETARLMGLPEDYRLPTRRTDAFHLTGDGVSVDAVRWLAENLIEPLLDGHSPKPAAPTIPSEVTCAA
jgi:DNA (cytosine-5)-methyltransferase 1